MKIIILIIKLFLGTVASYFLVTLVRYMFRKPFIRKRLKRDLENIVHQLAPCVQQGDTGSLHTLIGRAMDLSKEQNRTQETTANLNSLLSRLLLLEKRVQFFQNIIKHSSLSSIGNFSLEFVGILSDSAHIFIEFTQTLSNYEDISQKLKKDERGYPAFKERWSNVKENFEHVSDEARKVLPELKAKPLKIFISLPEL